MLAIVFAGAIDGIDGRIARLLRATSQFGAEFDSLSDFVCFGVAPAFVLYLWSLTEGAGRMAFLPSLMFAVCLALRLARFNASLSGTQTPAYAYNFFTGVPAPAAAGVVLFPLFAGLEAHQLGDAVAVLRRCIRRRWWPPSRSAARSWQCRRCRCGASRTSVCRRSSCCRCCWARAGSPRCWWPIPGRRWRLPD